MKKSIIFFALLLALFAPLFAQEEEESDNGLNSEISYYSAPIYKIFDSSTSYIVIYGTTSVKYKSVAIPKEWARYKKDEPKKLQVRELPPRMSPYISIVKKNGEFLKVVLTVPTSHKNSIWGIANENKLEDVSGVESVDLEI